MLWEHEVVGSNPIVPTKTFVFMYFKNVVIEHMAYALPEDVWSSARVEQALAPTYQRLGLQPGRLEMMTGIRERRHWDAQFLPSEAALLAGKALFQQSEFPRDRVDVLIHASVCRDRLEPATAAYVHQGLGLPESTQIFDLSNACLGVLNAMVVGASMIEAGTARSVLIVSGENGRSLLDHTCQVLNQMENLTRKDFKNYFANLTIGSGAVAVLLCHSRDASGPKPLLLGGCVRTNTSQNYLCEGKVTESGLSMQTQATALLEAGIELSRKAWEDFKQMMRWDASTPQHILTHQVGLQHRKQLYQALGLDMGKDFSTFQILGNTGSVALPITLCKAQEEHRFKMAERVLLLGIGSGLSTLMLGVLWQE